MLSRKEKIRIIKEAEKQAERNKTNQQIERYLMSEKISGYWMCDYFNFPDEAFMYAKGVLNVHGMSKEQAEKLMQLEAIREQK